MSPASDGRHTPAPDLNTSGTVGTLFRSADLAGAMEVLLGVWDEASLEALDRVLARTRTTGDEVAVAVLEDPAGGASVADLERRVRERLADHDATVDVRTPSGHPGSALVALAEREGFDRIALGGARPSPLGKVQLGPVVEFVVVNATVTVTLLR